MMQSEKVTIVEGSGTAVASNRKARLEPALSVSQVPKLLTKLPNGVQVAVSKVFPLFAQNANELLDSTSMA